MPYQIMAMLPNHTFLDIEAPDPEILVTEVEKFFKRHEHGLVGRMKINNVPIRGTWFRSEIPAFRRVLCTK